MKLLNKSLAQAGKNTPLLKLYQNVIILDFTKGKSQHKVSKTCSKQTCSKLYLASIILFHIKICS